MLKKVLGFRLQVTVGLILILFLFPITYNQFPILAGPNSETFELKDYGFGSGGAIDGYSESFRLYGISGEMDQGQGLSETYKLNEGLTYMIQANVPPAPTFTNPSSANYDRLKLIINTGGNSSDTVYAVAISKDNFISTQYVKSDFTVGTTLISTDWLPYSGAGSWSGASGVYISGLYANTTYKVKVKAMRGQFTETGWGPIAQETTSIPSLSFGVSPSSVSFNNLNTGNSYTDSSQTTTLTTSTNAYNGYTVYANESDQLRDGPKPPIPDFSASSASNSNPQSWSGIGFGYTTDDVDLTGGTANRFTGGKYAPFTTSIPGDPVADHAGPVQVSPVTNETFTISYRVTATDTTAAGKYTTTINYIVVPVY